MNELDRERRALELFEAMLELDEAERDAWLASHARDDEKLRTRISHLLDADRASQMHTGGAVEAVAIQEPPERIGAYRLIEEIGSGGMGVVYAARRDTGDFEHEVAIKIIKPGLLSDRLTERFTRERQLLASFSHPNIARLYDGGETDEGLPFIVMEKVDGVALGEWLEANNPSLSKRLALFLKVCEAVGYAHGNLVIHRDLTLANVLVEETGEPKLIDFGIALPDGAERRDGGGARARALRLLTLTPGYAAPERLQGEPATTLSDIYSAGRLLNAMIAKPRPGELQAIANKALSSDPALRYLSIYEMAEDVRRYIEHRPVAAFAGGTGYSIRKWFLRNPALSTSVVATLAAILIGIASTAWYAHQESVARAEADQRFSDTRTISKAMMFDIYDELEQVEGSAAARHRLAQTAQRYLEILASESNAPDLQLEAAQGYFRLAEVVGGRLGGGSLGRLGDAKQHYRRSRAILEDLYADYPDRKDVQEALAKVLVVTADAKLFNDGNFTEARKDALKARQLIEQLGTSDKVLVASLAATYLHVGNALAWEAKPEQAGKEYAAGLALIGSFPPDLRKAAEIKSVEADILQMNGVFHGYFKRPDEALAAFTQAVELRRQIVLSEGGGADAAVGLASALGALAAAQAANGREAAAREHAREAVAIARDGMRRNRDDYGLRQIFVKSAISYARSIASGENRSGVAALLKEAMDTRRDLASEAGDVVAARMVLAVDLQQSSSILLRSGHVTAACAQIREAKAIFDAYQKTSELPVANMENNLKPLLLDLQRCADR